MKRSRVVIAAVPVVALAFAAVIVLGEASRPAAAASAKKGVDPEADKLLRQMSDYLSGLKTFTVQNFAVDEMALKTGEKIQATSDSDIAVQRPNHIRNTQRGAGEGLGLWYDGKKMTVACKENNSYESVDAPADIDGAIDKLRKHFKVDAPGADLLYSNPYEILMEQVKSGRVIGPETILGVPAKHLAFQGEVVDFQIWIQDGKAPLPLRFVITTKNVKANPQFSVQLSNWNTNPIFTGQEFTFQPPPGGKAVPSVTSTCTR